MCTPLRHDAVQGGLWDSDATNKHHMCVGGGGGRWRAQRGARGATRGCARGLGTSAPLSRARPAQLHPPDVLLLFRPDVLLPLRPDVLLPLLPDVLLPLLPDSLTCYCHSALTCYCHSALTCYCHSTLTCYCHSAPAASGRGRVD